MSRTASLRLRQRQGGAPSLRETDLFGRMLSPCLGGDEAGISSDAGPSASLTQVSADQALAERNESGTLVGDENPTKMLTNSNSSPKADE